jgi:hypothetical protein
MFDDEIQLSVLLWRLVIFFLASDYFERCLRSTSGIIHSVLKLLEIDQKLTGGFIHRALLKKPQRFCYSILVNQFKRHRK